MRTHCRLSPVGIARLQCCNDLTVLPVGTLGSLVHGFRVVIKNRGWELEGRGQYSLQPWAISRARNDGVKFIVQLIKARQMLVPAKFGKGGFQFVLDGLQSLDVSCGDAQTGSSGGMAFKLAPKPKDFSYVNHRKACNLRAPVASKHHQTFACQPRERLSHRCATHADSLGQIGFEQDLAGCQFAANDTSADVPISAFDSAATFASAAGGGVILSHAQAWRRRGVDETRRLGRCVASQRVGNYKHGLTKPAIKVAHEKQRSAS